MNAPDGNAAAGFDFNRPTIIALLYLASFIVGITGLVGVILAYVWRGEPGEDWATSHYRFHIRTFWLALMGGLISALLSIILIGLLGFVVIGLWIIVRTVLAMLAAQKRQPIANPATYLW